MRAQYKTDMEMLQSCGLLINKKTKLKKKEKKKRKRFATECNINYPLLLKRDCVPHSVTRQGCSANLLTRILIKTV
jgi:hypothetical protein